MADLDPARAAFVQSNFRYASVADNAVRSNYADAREIVIDTNLANESDAIAFATAYLAEFKVGKRIFELTYRGTLDLDSWTAAPTFTFTDAKLNAVALPCKAISATVDYKAGTTAVVVRAG